MGHSFSFIIIIIIIITTLAVLFLIFFYFYVVFDPKFGGIATPADNVGHATSAMTLVMTILVSASAIMVLLAAYKFIRTRVGNSGPWRLTLGN